MTLERKISTSNYKKLAVTLAKRMAVIRKSRGLTQAQLAELVDIESETVSRFETGNSVPSLKRLCEIAEALNVDLASMLIDANVAADPKLRIAALLEDLQPADADLLVHLVHTLSRRLSSTPPS